MKRPVGRPPGLSGKLARWITKSQRKRSEVAAHLGISGRYFDALCRGEKIPNADLIERIARLTGGQITNAYWAWIGRARQKKPKV